MALGVGRFSLSQDLSSDFKFIRTDNYLDFCVGNPGALYYKRDFIFRSGVWRDAKVSRLWNQRPTVEGKILVIGHSDLRTNEVVAQTLVNGLGIKKIYGTNTVPIRGITVSLPIGLTNFTQESVKHNVFGNDEHLFLANSQEEQRSEFCGEIYINFSLATNRRQRGSLIKYLHSLNGEIKVTEEVPEFTDDGRVRYLRKLRASNFVVCPEGNGPDTHRLWETLYMGGIPIVKKSKYMNGLVSKLPVVSVSQWRAIGQQHFLESEWQRINSLMWDKSWLDQSFWNALIGSAKDGY